MKLLRHTAKTIKTEISVLKALAFASSRGQTHRERIENFYRHQAESYDVFRKRLLKGREQLWKNITLPAGGTWIDMGAGTGLNLDAVGADRARECKKIILVDLSPSLLQEAELRVKKMGLNNTELVLADATQFVSQEPCDLVSFTYSLTMIPDWFLAIDRALQNLNPGGKIATLDFFVSRKYESSPHAWATRSLLPIWFAHDNVFLSSDHLPYLRAKTKPLFEASSQGRLPYLPVKAPFYTFLGEKLAH